MFTTAKDSQFSALQDKLGGDFFLSFLDWDWFNDDQEFQIWEWKKKNNSRAFLYNSNNYEKEKIPWNWLSIFILFNFWFFTAWFIFLVNIWKKPETDINLITTNYNFYRQNAQMHGSCHIRSVEIVVKFWIFLIFS